VAQDSAAPKSGQNEGREKEVLIETSRFGEIEVDENRIIHFPEGILGFPQEKKFVILEHKPGSPFCWLQSVNSPELAFVMMNPLMVKKDYLEAFPASEKRLLEGDEGKHMALFAFVTIPRGQARKMSINLLGPILININKKTGRQLVLANSCFSTRQPVFPDSE